MISGESDRSKVIILTSIYLRWNFEKFLLDHNGQPLRRYDESLDPEDIIPDIDVLLKNLENGNPVAK